MTREQKLARLHNRRTAYELIITNGDRRYLVSYCQGKSRRSLLHAVQRWGEQIVKLAGAERIDFERRARDGATVGAWRVRWSGRTQREAVLDAELPFVGHLPA